MKTKEKTMLTFKATNLGVIEKGEFTQKPLTIFCGPNNSGKTWAMYSLYHFYDIYEGIEEYRQIDDEEKIFLDEEKFFLGEEDAIENIETFNQIMNSALSDVFNTTPASINNAEFNLQSPVGWEQEVSGEAFLMPAERNGLHLFFRELSTRRTALLHHASKEDINLSELLRDVIRSRYAKPIAHYINWLNGLTENRSRGKNNVFHKFALQVQKKLAQGVYKVDSRTSDITFTPHKKRGKNIKSPPSLGLHLTSSTVKSLFGLWFYLEHQAEVGDVLMIDEPELHIHPENQREIAKLLARLVNAGLKVVISTHSDYIVRELNTLIMLGRDKDKSLQRKHKYADDEVLQPEQIGAYLFDEKTIKPFEISPEDGIYATTFDEVISDLNATNDDIYYSLSEQHNED